VQSQPKIQQEQTMRKIINPFPGSEGYRCFACSPENAFGLNMTFIEDGDNVICNWEPRAHFQGYRNILHGGIQSTLLDELAAWIVFVKVKTSGTTTRIEVSYHKPVYTNQGTIKLQGRLIGMNGNIATVKAEIFDKNGTVCTDATVDYYTFPEKIARKKLYFPGYEKFFEKNNDPEGLE
jgi:uncharacterized protein (TIGR00369 family)